MEERRPVKQDRSAILYIILHILTFSLYDWFFFPSVVKDVNLICEKDGRRTRGTFIALAFSFLTFGISKYIWLADMIDRLAENAWRYNAKVRKSREELLMLMLFFPEFGYGYAVGVLIGTLNYLAAVYLEMQKIEAKQEHNNERESYKALNSNKPIPESVLLAAIKSAYDNEAREPESHETEKIDFKFGGLQGLTGAYAGSKIPIGVNQTIVLGRDASSVALVIEGEKISRIHCSIQYSGKRLGYHVTDHSRNGVFVNGVRIPYDVPTYASAGSIVALADGANKFQLMEYNG